MGKQTFDTGKRARTVPYAERTQSSERSRQALPGRAVYRRRRKKPSLWRHVLGALTILVVAGLAVATYVEMFGDAKDAIPQQEVSLAPLPQPAASDTLDGNGQALPDLLGAQFPLGENPTESIAQAQKLDELGNPIGGSTANETMAGEDMAASQNAASSITINGQPIASGLIPAPAPGLTRTSPYGLVPAKADDGRRAFDVYARPYTAAPNAKPVSLVIGGLGINRTLTQRAINELPAEVTLSFAAHAPNLQNQINDARAKGHEVLLELPMESADFDPAEPGADRALRVGVAVAVQNQRNLDWLLSRASGYFAVTNYNGELFLQRSDSVVPMMASLSEAGVGFVFDGSVTAPSLPTLANASRLPFIKAFALIDSAPDSGSITAELERMTSLAKGGAAPVGVGFTYPQTIDAVRDWVRTLEGNGLTLAPVSSRISPR